MEQGQDFKYPPTEPMLSLSFTVPYLTPPSVNHYKKPIKYRGKDGQLVQSFRITAEAKAYKDAVAIMARGDTVAPADPKQWKKAMYGVSAIVVLGKGVRLDADNGGKLLLDSLQYARVIHSDAFVRKFDVEVIKDDRANPRTEFKVWRIQ